MSRFLSERRSLVNIERGIQGYRDVDGNVYITGITTSALISQYRRARQESHGICDFLIIFLGIFSNSIFLTIGWVTALIVPICMIVLGTLYIEMCPEEEMIPLLLLVGGVLLMVIYALDRIQNCGNGQNSDEPRTSCCFFINVMYFVLTAWLIANSYYVYRTYKPNFDDIHCNRTLYTFSFWFLNFFYVFVSVMFLIIFCGICMYCIGD